MRGPLRSLLVAAFLGASPAQADDGSESPEPPVVVDGEPVDATADGAPFLEKAGGTMQDNDYGNVAPSLQQPTLGEPDESDAHPRRSRSDRLFGPIDREGREVVDLYGSFRSHLAFEDRTVEIQNNSSRFGIRAGATVPNVLTVYARGEWGVAFGSSATYNLDGNQALTAASDQVLSTRLGVIGITSKGGGLSFGKQWSAYYDVTSYTYAGNVVQGRASATFNSGTDGGLTGTGRAANALMYRFEAYGLKFALQTQLFGEKDSVFDALGASVRYVTKSGFEVGLAYNRSFIDYADFGIEAIGYLTGDPIQAASVGARFQNDGWYVAALYTNSVNQESAQRTVDGHDRDYFYDTNGFELYLQHMWFDAIGPYVLYNMVLPRKRPAALSDEFMVQVVGIGVQGQLYQYARLYAELSQDFGRDPWGNAHTPQLYLGVRVDFSSQRALEALVDRQRSDD